MIEVGIYGASGYMGGEALRISSENPKVKAVWATSKSEKSRWSGGMAQNTIQNVASSSDTEGSIALGQIKVNATVTVSFELK